MHAAEEGPHTTIEGGSRPPPPIRPSDECPKLALCIRC